MNAALLMMSSTFLAGADAAPAAPPPLPPAVVAGTGCGSPGCGPVASDGCCDTCGGGGRVRLLDRIKARFGGRKHNKGTDCCEPAPCTSCTPPPPPAPCCEPAPCDACCSAKVSFLDKIKSRCGRKKADCCAAPAPACDGCAAPPAAWGPAPGVIPTAPADAPKEMPKPSPTPMPKPKASTSTDTTLPAIPTPGASVVPAPTVVFPVSGMKLTGTSSPY